MTCQKKWRETWKRVEKQMSAAPPALWRSCMRRRAAGTIEERIRRIGEKDLFSNRDELASIAASALLQGSCAVDMPRHAARRADAAPAAHRKIRDKGARATS